MSNEPEDKQADPNMRLRTVSIGVCSTLDRAAEMGVHGATEMRDLLRQTVFDAIQQSQDTKFKQALEHIAAGNLSPSINFAQWVLDGMSVEDAHKKQIEQWDKSE